MPLKKSATQGNAAHFPESHLCIKRRIKNYKYFAPNGA